MKSPNLENTGWFSCPLSKSSGGIGEAKWQHHQLTHIDTMRFGFVSFISATCEAGEDFMGRNNQQNTGVVTGYWLWISPALSFKSTNIPWLVLHPWKLTWNKIMEVWKIISFQNGWFLGSMLIFQGVSWTSNCLMCFFPGISGTDFHWTKWRSIGHVLCIPGTRRTLKGFPGQIKRRKLSFCWTKTSWVLLHMCLCFTVVQQILLSSVAQLISNTWCLYGFVRQQRRVEVYRNYIGILPTYHPAKRSPRFGSFEDMKWSSATGYTVT